MPPKRLQQDVRTQWNSSYYMNQSLLAERQALCAYTAEYDLPATLTATKWGLLEKTVQALAPFEELTREVSSSSASASDVIPIVQVLKRLLSQPQEADEGIRTMKGTLLEAVRRRFTHLETEPIYSVATLLDPRYKDSGGDLIHLRASKEDVTSGGCKQEETFFTKSWGKAHFVLSLPQQVVHVLKCRPTSVSQLFCVQTIHCCIGMLTNLDCPPWQSQLLNFFVHLQQVWRARGSSAQPLTLLMKRGAD